MQGFDNQFIGNIIPEVALFLRARAYGEFYNPVLTGGEGGASVRSGSN